MKAMLKTTVQTDTLLERIDFYREEATNSLEQSSRFNLGQFFTPPLIAKFMASLFEKSPKTINLLDAGAGVGSLSAACISEFCEREKRPERINLTAYEIDDTLIEYLRATMEEIKTVCENNDIAFSVEIIQRSFVEDAVGISGRDLFSPSRGKFDFAIMNPPYRKIRNNSTDRALLRKVGIETSNLYTAFLWLVIKLLEQNGELVAIVPRSFCNGPYFKPFRKALLSTMTLRRIHSYESRSKVFHNEEILQENIIFHAVKTPNEKSEILISSSDNYNDLHFTSRTVGYSQVINPNDPDFFIHIAPDEISGQISKIMNGLDSSLKDLDLQISTGRVVDFRAKELLRKEPAEKTFPLIYPVHFSDGFISWPNGKTKKPNAIADEPKTADLLVPSTFYVLLKRFTAKEEKRRLVAAVYDPRGLKTEKVGFENHLNYIHSNGAPLSPELAKGIAAFLNSTLVDQYFRLFNGHTQVNATDLRSIKFPKKTTLLSIGSRIGDTFPPQNELDSLIMEELNIMDEDPQNIDPLKAKQKIDEAVSILQALNFPRAQLNKRSGLTLLSLLDLKVDSPWSEASDPFRGITEMMDYFREYYGVTYAPNTRETVRRQTVHQFVQAGLIVANPDNPARPVNSPDNRYQIEISALKLIRTFGTREWKKNLEAYLKTVTDLTRLHAKEREMTLIPVKLPDGCKITLTGGGQNILIKRIVEDFCPRFTPDGMVVYIGDAGYKISDKEHSYLKKLGVDLDRHGKMPDVIVHLKKKNWLVLIEAVTSHGPVDIKRHNELKELFENCDSGLVFVTAFENRITLKKFLSEIAWETEVWVADAPSHLIHFNGERFLGPYE